MSFLTFDRVDITQTGQAERGTMEVLPLSKGKRRNKIVLGDASGTLTALGMRKGEESRGLVFRNALSSEPITSLTLGSAKGQEDKIFVASGTTVRGINKKGKEFFKFSTNLTEPISHIHVDHTNIWASGTSVSNHYVDGQDASFFKSDERISDVRVAPVVLEREKNQILACKDRFIRVVQGGELYYEAAVPGAASALSVCLGNDEARRQMWSGSGSGSGSADARVPPGSIRNQSQKTPPNQQHAGRREVLFGTEQGSVGQLFLDGESVVRGWVIDSQKGGVTAIHAECDLTGDGVNDVVVGRDDGSLEVYSFDENGDPTLSGAVDLREQIQTIKHGRVTTPFPEIIAHTFSGKVLAFKPGLDSTTADGFAMGETLDDAQLGVRRFKDNQRADALTAEIAKLKQEVHDARAAYKKRSGSLIAADGACAILARLKLSSTSATHTLTLEAPRAIESVAVFADVEVDLLDEYGGGDRGVTGDTTKHDTSNATTAGKDAADDASAAIVSRTPLPAAAAAGGAAATALAVYRLPSDTQNRFEIEMRCVEGRAGVIRACVVPLQHPKTCVEVVKEIKPLCLHQRRREASFEDGVSGSGRPGDTNGDAGDVLGDDRAVNVLTVTGGFSLEDAHQWTFECLDEVPSNCPSAVPVGGLFADSDESARSAFGDVKDRGGGYVFSYDYENVLLKTRLVVKGKEGELRFCCDGVTPLALVKEFIGRSATKANLQIRFIFDADQTTPSKFAKLTHHLIENAMTLVDQESLIVGLRELKMQEPEIDNFLSPEWRGVLLNADAIVKQAAARRGAGLSQ